MVTNGSGRRTAGSRYRAAVAVGAPDHSKGGTAGPASPPGAGIRPRNDARDLHGGARVLLLGQHAADGHRVRIAVMPATCSGYSGHPIPSSPGAALVFCPKRSGPAGRSGMGGRQAPAYPADRGRNTQPQRPRRKAGMAPGRPGPTPPSRSRSGTGATRPRGVAGDLVRHQRGEHRRGVGTCGEHRRARAQDRGRQCHRDPGVSSTPTFLRCTAILRHRQQVRPIIHHIRSAQLDLRRSPPTLSRVRPDGNRLPRPRPYAGRPAPVTEWTRSNPPGFPPLRCRRLLPVLVLVKACG